MHDSMLDVAEANIAESFFQRESLEPVQLRFKDDALQNR